MNFELGGRNFQYLSVDLGVPWTGQVSSEYTLIRGTFILVGIYLTAKNNTLLK